MSKLINIMDYSGRLLDQLASHGFHPNETARNNKDILNEAIYYVLGPSMPEIGLQKSSAFLKALSKCKGLREERLMAKKFIATVYKPSRLRTFDLNERN